jgi:hypothetical protein
LLFAKYDYNSQVEENEVDGDCNTNGGEVELVLVIGRETIGNELTEIWMGE